MTTVQIWNSFEERLFHFILSKVKDRDISKDLLHDVFEKIHLKVGTLESANKLESWLFAITRNTINDYFRKSKSTEKLDQELDFEQNHELIDDSEDSNKEGLIGCLIPFLDKLPEQHKSVLNDYHFKQKSQKQIAQERGLAYPTIRSQIQRGRKMLFDQFVSCCKEQIEKSDFTCETEETQTC